MGQEIPWETREEAEERYITVGETFDQVSRATGVSVTQLQRWGKAGDWGARRREYRRELSDIRRGTVQLRARLLKAALSSNSPDPQTVYAFARVEQVANMVAARSERQEAAREMPPDPININSPGDAVDALVEIMERRMARMLAQPEALKLSAVKDLKQTLELVETLKAKYRPEAKETERKGLSPELAEQIRQEILGVKKAD